MRNLFILTALLIGSAIAEAQPEFAITVLPVAAKIDINKTVYRHFTLCRYSADGIAYRVYYINHRRWPITILS
jgi:hypothetical protein